MVYTSPLIYTHTQNTKVRNKKKNRVEVEFQTGLSDMVILLTTAVNTSVRPILAVDSVESPELVAALSRALKDQGARWQEIEHDRFSPSSSILFVT